MQIQETASGGTGIVVIRAQHWSTSPDAPRQQLGVDAAVRVARQFVRGMSRLGFHLGPLRSSDSRECAAPRSAFEGCAENVEIVFAQKHI